MVISNEMHLFDNDTVHSDLYVVVMLCNCCFLIIVWFPLSDHAHSSARSRWIPRPHITITRILWIHNCSL